MNSDAKPLTSNSREYSSNEARAGKPDVYKDFPGSRDAGEGWKEPAPLPEGLPSVDAFNDAMLPAPWQPWIMDTAERMQIPVDFPAAGAVVVASSLVSRKFGIHPMRYDPWLVVPNLWGA